MSIATAALATLASLLVAAAPPAGRPPVGPLERVEPEIYDVEYRINLTTVPTTQHDPNSLNPVYPAYPDGRDRRIDLRQPFELANTPIAFPLIMQSTYSVIDQRSLQPMLRLGNVDDPDVSKRSRIDDGFPFHTHMAVITIEEADTTLIEWSVSFRAQVWSSRIDDRAAAQIAWPQEWPHEVASGLQPQHFIESDDPIFRETVDRISNGRLRMVPPYLAAKDIVRYVILNVKETRSMYVRGRLGMLHGLWMQGAAATAKSGEGSDADIVCVCIAMLRAAGIPARPVIGVQDDQPNGKTLRVWGEFFLPDAGWIPFDPAEMSGHGLTNKDVREPWDEFGTMDDLNQRVPLAYHFFPPAGVISYGYPALWGWMPSGDVPNAEQSIQIDVNSRGDGVDDPR